MNGLPYYKAYPRDFIEGTIGMPFEVKGAYRLVLDLIYMQSGKLPDDPRYISGLLGCSIRKWKSLRTALIDANKIEVSGEFLTNYRADKELETLAKLQDNQREKATRPNKNKGLQKPRLSQPEPEPYIEKRETKVSPKKKAATRLPNDWIPNQKFIDFALNEGLNNEQITFETKQFRDYWIAKSNATNNPATKLDWLATWRMWIRRSDKNISPRHSRTSTGREDLYDAFQSVASENNGGIPKGQGSGDQANSTSEQGMAISTDNDTFRPLFSGERKH